MFPKHIWKPHTCHGRAPEVTGQKHCQDSLGPGHSPWRAWWRDRERCSLNELPRDALVTWLSTLSGAAWGPWPEFGHSPGAQPQKAAGRAGRVTDPASGSRQKAGTAHVNFPLLSVPSSKKRQTTSSWGTVSPGPPSFLQSPLQTFLETTDVSGEQKAREGKQETTGKGAPKCGHWTVLMTWAPRAQSDHQEVKELHV